MDEPSDRVLVERSLSGEVEAYGGLVGRYQTSVYAVCLRLMGDRFAAEDMSQEAFVRAFHRLDTFDTGRPFGPWIRRVAANVCLNALGGSSLVQLPLHEETERHEPERLRGPEEAQIVSEERTRVRAALFELPAHYRAVIELRHYHELRYAQIAEALGLSLSEVKTRLYRARRLLAQTLLEDEQRRG